MGSRFRLLRRLSAANLRHHKWRWVLTTVGIAIGVASFAGILAISRSIIYAFELSVTRTAGRAQLQVSNGSAGIAADLVSDILHVPGVEAASGTVQYDVTVPSSRRRLTIFGILLGENHAYRESQFGSHALQLPDAGTFLVKTDSIALTPALQHELGLDMGSSINVVGPKGPRTLTVRGTVQDQGALSVFGGDVGVMDAEAAQQSFGELDRFHWIDVVVGGNADVDTVRHVIEATVGARGVVETPLGRGGRMEAMLGTLRWIMTANGTLSMLVGIFLIQHTVSTAIARRRADFVKLRAIGATRWTIVLTVFVEALLVGAVGSIIGIAGGLGFAKLAVRVLGDSVSTMYVSLPPPPVTLTRGEFAASFALGCGAVIFATLLPGLQLLRLRPLALGAPVEVTDARTPGFGLAAAGVLAVAAGVLAVRLCGLFGFAGGVASVGTFAGLLFLGTALIVPLLLAAVTPVASRLLRAWWGSLGFWAWSQLVRHRFHTATTVGALAAAVAFTVGLTTLLGSYRGAIAPWMSQRLVSDVFVIAGAQFSLLTGPTIAPDVIDEIRQVKGVAAAMPWRFVQVQFRGKPIIVQSIPQVLIRRWHPDVTEQLEDGSVIISETLAERFKLDVGDRITVPAPLQPVSVRVGAVAADYLLDLGNLTLPWDVFVQHFGDRHANILFVDASPGVDGLDLKRRIEEQLAGRTEVTVLTGNELRDMTSAMIDQSFALTDALQFLAVLVTVLAMINATTAAILDRAFDLAVWRALGLERGRLIRVLVVEAAVLGLLGSILGIGAGAIMGQMFVKVVAPVVAGFRMAVTWPIIGSLVAVVLTMAFAGATASLVARSQMPRPIVLRSLRS